MTHGDELVKAIQNKYWGKVEYIFDSCCTNSHRNCANFGCSKCMVEYLKKSDNKPMPELKDGTMVECQDYEGGLNIGVIIGNKVVYNNGVCIGFDTKDITKVWGKSVDYFSACKHNKPIWEKED